MSRHHNQAWLRALAAATGLVLTVIGVRFLIVPDSAVRTFGLSPAGASWHLAALIGLRDAWLGVLVMAFAALRDWRGLMLWLGCGVPVCLGDAAIVAAAGGPSWAIAFHAVAGIFMAALVFVCRVAGGESE